MKYFTVDLKEEFPLLKTKQNPTLTCYINDSLHESQPERKTPAVLICPGGAYRMVCFSREGEPIALNYLREGYSAFVLNYSVAPERYPEQLLEAACAILYIRKHTEEWHIDGKKIAVNGYSAGGHLAASLGVFWNNFEICGALGVSPEEIRPDAMVLGYPVISAGTPFCNVATINNLTGTSDEESPAYKNAALETKVGKDTPPAYIWHTAEDGAVPCENSLVFAAALSKNKVTYELHIFPYGEHGLATADAVTNAAEIVNSPAYYCHGWIDESVKFLASIGF